jgi:hypothetical protein
MRLMIKPLGSGEISAVNFREVSSMTTLDQGVRKGLRLFLEEFSINATADNPKDAVNNVCETLMIKAEQTISLHRDKFSHLPKSFIVTIRQSLMIAQITDPRWIKPHYYAEVILGMGATNVELPASYMIQKNPLDDWSVGTPYCIPVTDLTTALIGELGLNKIGKILSKI